MIKCYTINIIAVKPYLKEVLQL